MLSIGCIANNGSCLANHGYCTAGSSSLRFSHDYGYSSHGCAWGKWSRCKDHLCRRNDGLIIGLIPGEHFSLWWAACGNRPIKGEKRHTIRRQTSVQQRIRCLVPWDAALHAYLPQVWCEILWQLQAHQHRHSEHLEESTGWQVLQNQTIQPQHQEKCQRYRISQVLARNDWIRDHSNDSWSEARTALIALTGRLFCAFERAIRPARYAALVWDSAGSGRQEEFDSTDQ